MINRVLLAVLILAYPNLIKSDGNFYSLSAEDVDQNNVSFATYHGKVRKIDSYNNSSSNHQS